MKRNIERVKLGPDLIAGCTPRRYQVLVRGVPVSTNRAAKVEQRRKWRANGTMSRKGRWTGAARIRYRQAFGHSGRHVAEAQGRSA